MFEKIRLILLEKSIALLKSDIWFEEEQLEIMGESSCIEIMKKRLASLEEKHDKLFLNIQLKAKQEEMEP